jgi:hypothetical protein
MTSTVWRKSIANAAKRRKAAVRLRSMSPIWTATKTFALLHTRSAWLRAEKMKECIWVKPRILAEIEFLEWSVLQKCTDEGVNMT